MSYAPYDAAAAAAAAAISTDSLERAYNLKRAASRYGVPSDILNKSM